MLKPLNWKTTIYEYKDGFYVELTETLTMFEAYIFHRDYGVKELMFAVEKPDKVLYGIPVDATDTVLGMVENNVDHYAVAYYEDYMSEDDYEYDGEGYDEEPGITEYPEYKINIDLRDGKDKEENEKKLKAVIEEMLRHRKALDDITGNKGNEN